MELIPIIYTVLEIVVAITAVTLIVSYLGYKFKQKERAAITPEKQASEIKLPAPKAVAKPQSIPQKPQIKKKAPQPASRLTKEQRKTKSKSSTKEQPKHKGKEIPGHNKRIEIMKNLRNTKTKDNQFKSDAEQKPKTRISSLGEDILGKYAGEDDKNLYTLNVPDKKKKGE